MKIYISGLPLTLAVILHIHVSSSMHPQTRRQNVLGLAAPRAEQTMQQTGMMTFPYRNPQNEYSIPIYDSLEQLSAIDYAGTTYKIGHLRTDPGSEDDIPTGTHLYRCVKGKEIGAIVGVRKNRQFISEGGCLTSPPCVIVAQKNDFLAFGRSPYGWYSPQSLQLFAHEYPSAHASPNESPSRSPSKQK